MGDQHESYSEMLEQSLNLRWPKKGDRLFKESPNWEQSVKIPNDIISRHAHIWGGNMRAGAVLIGAYKGNNSERHSLIYPILFNLSTAEQN